MPWINTGSHILRSHITVLSGLPGMSIVHIAIRCRLSVRNLVSPWTSTIGSEVMPKPVLKYLSRASTWQELTRSMTCKRNLQFAEGLFRPQLAKDKPKKKIDAGDIVGDPSKMDEGSYFYGKAVCFTGAFQYGIRRELLQRIADIGGYSMTSVTKETDILVVGQQDYWVVGDSGMSSKQKKAMAMREKGMDIEIMSEVDFLSNL